MYAQCLQNNTLVESVQLTIEALNSLLDIEFLIGLFVLFI